MQILDSSFDWPSFESALRTEGPQRLLFLDYDGTLAPFTSDRDNARPYAGVVDLLRRIQRHRRTRLVIVSGRSIADLPRLLGLDEVPELWGSHGWEHLTADGSYSRGEVPLSMAHALSVAAHWVRERGLLERLEVKPMSVALHWRGASTLEEPELRRLATQWQTLAHEASMDLHAFDGGIELRVLGRTKAHAVAHVLREVPNCGPAAFLGDDKTDEEAFSALRSRDLGVLVRPELRPTQAKLWLRPPGELLQFLELWA